MRAGHSLPAAAARPSVGMGARAACRHGGHPWGVRRRGLDRPAGCAQRCRTMLACISYRQP
eukprot:1810650-Prorocentrum_lima.AAC.1